MSKQEQVNFLVKLFFIPITLLATLFMLSVLPWGIVLSWLSYAAMFVCPIVAAICAMPFIRAVIANAKELIEVLGYCAMGFLLISPVIAIVMLISVAKSEPGFWEHKVTSDEIRVFGEMNLRNSMKDPSSFRKVGSEKVAGGSIITYRAKNGFGATVTEQAFIPH